MKLDSKGSVSVFLVAVTPLLILVLAILAATSLLLVQWQRTHQICNLSLMSTQTKTAQSFNRLFALNPLARTLRTERKLAEQLQRAALLGGPKAIAAAKAYYASVVVRQYALRSAQEALKLKIRVEGMHDMSKVLLTLKNEKGVGGWPVFSPLQLAVRQTPRSSLTPDYDAQKNFSERQTLRGSWTIKPKNVFPVWLASLIPELGTIRGECVASLRRKGTQWTPTLGAGKSSWN
jgi:hypothetical protein